MKKSIEGLMIVLAWGILMWLVLSSVVSTLASADAGEYCQVNSDCYDARTDDPARYCYIDQCSDTPVPKTTTTHTIRECRCIADCGEGDGSIYDNDGEGPYCLECYHRKFPEGESDD